MSDAVPLPLVAPSTPAVSPPSPPALFAMLGGTFMVVLDFFIVNVALPSIQADLAAGDDALQLVVVGYGLANAASLVAAGRLGDLYGRRRVFCIGVALFVVASIACGLAPTAPALVVARVAQGAAGALVQPQVLAMLGLLYTGAARAKAFAAYGLAMGLAGAGGQVVGGLLIDANVGGLGWRACFLVNVPIGLASVILVRRTVPPLSDGAGRRLDLAGVALLTTALVACVGPLVEGREHGWPRSAIACLAASPPLFAAFRWHQRSLARRGGEPLIAPELFASDAFRFGLAITFVMFVGNASLYFVLALFLQHGLGMTPLASGLAFSVLAVGFVAASTASPALVRRLGPRAIVAGAAILTVGHAALTAAVAVGAAGRLAVLLPVLAIEGVGLGSMMAPLASVVLAVVPARHAGVASGVMAMIQQIGNAVGVAAIGIVFYAVRGADLRPAAAFDAFGASALTLTGLAAALTVAIECFVRRSATSRTEARPPAGTSASRA